MTTPLALVTGASTGIGAELVAQFTSHGHDVLACADEPVPAATGVRAVTADLRSPDGVRTVLDALAEDGRPVAAAALNAGVGRGDAFVEQPLADVLAIVDLNVRSTVELAWHVLRAMVGSGSGRVLVSSSIASMMPGPYQAVYNASKSFLQSFVLGVQAELHGSGVTLTSLMPGPTDTRFFDRADMAQDTVIGRGPKDDPAQVAAQGYAAMMAGKSRVVGGGLSTRVQYLGGQVLPDGAKALLHSVIARKR